MSVDDVIKNEDIEEFKNTVEEFKELQETEYSKAFYLHKKALIQYDRWSYILFLIKKSNSARGANADIKERVKQVLEILNNIYLSARMVWNRGKEDSLKDR